MKEFYRIEHLTVKTTELASLTRVSCKDQQSYKSRTDVIDQCIYIDVDLYSASY